MTIAWDQFTPWTSLAGGLLVGVAVSLFILGNGRIAGISTLIASPLQAVLTRASLKPERTRLAFIVGLLAAPWAWQAVAPLPAVTSVAGTLTLLLAGLLVGVGARMGKGCTSGHGVCGLSRLSPRSLANVAVFMGSGVITVLALRQLA